MTAARRLAIASLGYRGAGGGGTVVLNSINLDEIEFELMGDVTAELEPTEVEAVVESEIVATVEPEIDAEVEC